MSSKKKLLNNSTLVAKMNKQLNDLQQTIENMDEKRGNIFLEWLNNQNKYLVWEETFDPLRLKKYKRGEVVLVQFGFNVGAEYGGMHYAVIIKKDKKTNPLLNVVPLSSLKNDETTDVLHADELFLGSIDGLNEKKSFAILNQMRPVSKLRVFKPRTSGDDTVMLSNDQLDMLDKKIAQMYTKKNESEGNSSKSEENS